MINMILCDQIHFSPLILQVTVHVGLTIAELLSGQN